MKMYHNLMEILIKKRGNFICYPYFKKVTFDVTYIKIPQKKGTKKGVFT